MTPDEIALREQIARAACEAGNHAVWPQSDGYTDRDEKRAWFRIADAILALPALRSQAQEIAGLKAGLRELLDYTAQVELLVYAADDTDDHEVVARARLLSQETTP